MLDFLKFLKKEKEEAAEEKKKKVCEKWVCDGCGHAYYYRMLRCLFCSAVMKKHVYYVSCELSEAIS